MQIPCAKSSAVSNVFDEINTFGNKLTTKSDDSVRFFFKNLDGLQAE